MKKKNKKIICSKGTSLLAAAALSFSLLQGTAALAFAGEDGMYTQNTPAIPDNVTVERPGALADILLPVTEYGTLLWEDDSFVPDKRVQSCPVILTPAEGVDLSEMDGWDEEKGVVKSFITVVVSSISESQCQEEGIAGEISEEEQGEAFVPQDGLAVEAASENENGTSSGDGPKDETSDGQEGVLPDHTEEGTQGILPDNLSGAAEGIFPEDMEAPQEGIVAEEIGLSDAGTTGSETENTDWQDSAEIDTALQLGGTEIAAQKPDGVLNSGQTDDMNPVSVFSENSFQEEYSVGSAEELTEEEMEMLALENHSCAGISVSGINLPWYVQFRVSNGDSYRFTNETDAAIFQSFEFQLWDLINDREYEIPDGEYISVTVPVKTGYEYTIEHILDNGAVETIIPSVDGGVMVFSTHSFSPFGIAGSKTIIGSDIAEAGYSDKEGGEGDGNVQTTPTADQNGNQEKDSDQVTAPEDNKGSDDSQGNTDQENAKKNSQDPSVNTGDNTNIVPFVILFLAAVIIIVVVVVIKKKK